MVNLLLFIHLHLYICIYTSVYIYAYYALKNSHTDMMHQCKALVTVSIPALHTHSSSRSLKTFDTIIFSVLQLVNMVRQVIVRGLL